MHKDDPQVKRILRPGYRLDSDGIHPERYSPGKSVVAICIQWLARDGVRSNAFGIQMAMWLDAIEKLSYSNEDLYKTYLKQNNEKLAARYRRLCYKDDWYVCKSRAQWVSHFRVGETEVIPDKTLQRIIEKAQDWGIVKCQFLTDKKVNCYFTSTSFVERHWDVVSQGLGRGVPDAWDSTSQVGTLHKHFPNSSQNHLHIPDSSFSLSPEKAQIRDSGFSATVLPTDIPGELGTAWHTALAAIHSTRNPIERDFRLFLVPLIPVSYEGQTLTVSAPSIMARKWAQEKWASSIAEEFGKILGETIDVHIVIRS